MCGFNPICYITEFFAPFWTFIVWGFWIVLAVVVLGILARVHQVFGWQGVATALVALAGGVGYFFGRRSRDDYPSDVPEEDAKSPFQFGTKKKPRRTAKRTPPVDTGPPPSLT